MTMNRSLLAPVYVCLSVSLILSACKIMAQAVVPVEPAQQQPGPELIPQPSPEIGFAPALFGASGRWLVQARGQGEVLLYDLVGGRVSHRFSDGSGNAVVAVHPARDLAAMFIGSSLLVYDVNQGAVLWKQALSKQCTALHFSADGSRLIGVCLSPGVIGGAEASAPHKLLAGWQTETGAEAAMPALAEDYEPGGVFSEDGRWVVGSKTIPTVAPGGQPKMNIFKSMSQALEAIKVFNDHAILDTETGQVVSHFTEFMPQAISARAHTVAGFQMMNVNTGTVIRSLLGRDSGQANMPRLELIDVLNPSAKHIVVQESPGLVQFAIPQVSANGKYFVLPRMIGAVRVDAETGAVESPAWKNLPFMSSVAVTRDGDQVAFVQGGSIVLSRFSNPEETRASGSASLEANTQSTMQALVNQRYGGKEAENEEKARVRQEAKEMAKIKAPSPRSFWWSSKKKYEQKVDEYQEKIAAVQTADEDARKKPQQELEQKFRDAMMKFGGPVVIPPLATFLDGGRLLVIRGADASWGIWDAATGNHIAVQKVDLNLESANNIVQSPESLLDQEDVQKIEKNFGSNEQVRDADAGRKSQYAQLRFEYPIPGNIESKKYYSERGPEGYGLRVSDKATHKVLYDIPEVFGDVRFLDFAPSGKVILGADRSNTLGFWDRDTGKRLATLYAYQEGEWLLVTTSGLFDGSPRSWRMIGWRDPAKGNATLPAEAFFSEFYRPGLLADILLGHVPQPPRTIDQIDRRQPSVHITSDLDTTANRSVTVHLALAEAAEGGTPGGVRDVRLFRNGVLVRIWHGELPLQNGTASLEADVALISGENHFVAYAFNRDSVKSLDTELMVRCTAPPEPRTAYILAIGVNRYSNPEFNLNYAEPDARHFTQILAESLQGVGNVDRIVPVALLNAEATKENLLGALDVLSGRTQAPVTQTALASLRQTRPGDMVVFYFAGHGLAWDDHFYLIPHDMGFSGPREELPGSLNDVLHHGISDFELEKVFEGLDASSVVLVIDACNSGKALDSEDTRHGPMNSKGLAQLAYEKGMYVLTASQAFQAALESSKLGHGYLTYALVDEGLESPNADTSPQDGKVTVVEWFEYAAHRVPQMQSETLNQIPVSAGRKLDFAAVPSSPGPTGESSAVQTHLQTPRLYYRHDNRPGQAAIVHAYASQQ